MMEKRILFRNFTDLDTELLSQILRWRNDESVRKWMHNSEIISLESHLSFVKSLKESTQKFYYIAWRNLKPCGVVNLSLKSDDKETGEWGLYLAPKYIGTGIGLEVGFEAINMFFSKFRLNRLIGIVKSNNLENINLQAKLGFRKDIYLPKNDSIQFVISRSDLINLPKNFKEFQTKLFYERKS